MSEPTVTLADLRYVLSWFDNETLTEFKRDPDGARLFALIESLPTEGDDE